MYTEMPKPGLHMGPRMDNRAALDQRDFVVVGGGIGSLVTALCIAREGANVSLLLPGRGVGAGFVSIEDQGFLLDVGCRRFDFTQDAVRQPLSSFYLGARNRPFAGHAKDFIERSLGLTLAATPPPLLAYNGKLVPDFATSLDLTSLRALVSPDDLARIVSETDAILAADDANPVTLGLGSWPDLSRVTLKEASLVNHGPVFHARFIEPFANKLFKTGWESMPADLIAKIWTPLFFPRTINQGARGEVDRDRPPVTYYYPAAGHFGAFASALIDAVNKETGIHKIETTALTSLMRTGAHIVATQAEGPALQWRAPFSLGISVENYLALAGQSACLQTLPINIHWLEIAECDLAAQLDTVMVFDSATPIYRVSRAGHGAAPGHAILAAEMTGGPDAASPEATASSLKQLGILHEDACPKLLRVQADLKIIAPSQANRDALRAARQTLEERGIHPTLIGTLNDLKSDMLNDQILQGLALGRSFAHAL